MPTDRHSGVADFVRLESLFQLGWSFCNIPPYNSLVPNQSKHYLFYLLLPPGTPGSLYVQVSILNVWGHVQSSSNNPKAGGLAMQYVVSKYADRCMNSCSIYSLQAQLHLYPLGPYYTRQLSCAASCAVKCYTLSITYNRHKN